MRKDSILSNLCNAYDLRNLVSRPTCSEGAQPAALDVILSSELKRIKHIKNKPCFLSGFPNVICTATKVLCPPIVPGRIYYRSYKHFNEESYVRDLHSAPFAICDIFDDPHDKAWCFSKVPYDVMGKNAPVKSKVVKKPQIPYMNSKLRKAMHRRNMLRNRYKKGPVEWDVCRTDATEYHDIHLYIRNLRLPTVVNVVKQGQKIKSFGKPSSRSLPLTTLYSKYHTKRK